MISINNTTYLTDDFLFEQHLIELRYKHIIEENIIIDKLKEFVDNAKDKYLKFVENRDRKLKEENIKVDLIKSIFKKNILKIKDKINIKEPKKSANIIVKCFKQSIIELKAKAQLTGEGFVRAFMLHLTISLITLFLTILVSFLCSNFLGVGASITSLPMLEPIAVTIMALLINPLLTEAGKIVSIQDGFSSEYLLIFSIKNFFRTFTSVVNSGFEFMAGVSISIISFFSHIITMIINRYFQKIDQTTIGYIISVCTQTLSRLFESSILNLFKG